MRRCGGGNTYPCQLWGAELLAASPDEDKLDNDTEISLTFSYSHLPIHTHTWLILTVLRLVYPQVSTSSSNFNFKSSAATSCCYCTIEEFIFLSKWHPALVLTASKCSLGEKSSPAVKRSTRVVSLLFPTSSTLKLFPISLPILFRVGINLSTLRPFGIDISPSLRCREHVVRCGLHSCDISGSALRCMMAWRQERDYCVSVMGVLLLRTKHTQKNLFDSWRSWQCVNQAWRGM